MTVEQATIKVIAVVGPTGTGKTDLALDLADRIGTPANVEIVNGDAMQLYRGMDIGTAKLPESQRRGYQHHLMDVLDVSEDASVATYQREGRKALQQIASRGARAIAVGGSGLYLRALLDQMEFPPTDPQVRAGLERQLDRSGPPALHARLDELDPVAARRIGPANGRRLVRALEVIALTNRPYSATLPQYEYAVPAVQIGLRMPLDQLDTRLETRARRMFDNGLVEEVRGLDAAGIREGTTARRATGYAQALAVLDGRLSVKEAWQRTAIATRQLARRQIKWFRRDPRIHWVDVDGSSQLIEAALGVIEKSEPTDLQDSVPLT